MQIYFHSRLCSYLSRVPILMEGTVHTYMHTYIHTYIHQGSRVRPNFSRVRLTKIWGRTCVTSRSRKEKKSPVSPWFSNRHALGSYRGPNQSEIVKGGPPLWLAVVQIFLYVCVRLKMRHVCCCSQTYSVANLARFNAFLNPFLKTLFFQKSWTNDKSSDFLDKL